MAPTSESLAASEELSARGATAPRVSLADMNAAIASEHYVTLGEVFLGSEPHPAHPLDLMTLCAITLQNGFVVLGKSAPASPENFDAEKGRTFSREDAIRQLWPLMGFALRDRLHREAELLGARVVTTTAPDMGTFIGTKVVNARPTTRGEYVALRGWELPADEEASDEGYLVEYTDKADGNVPGFAGYVTWSPKDVFDRAYRPA